MELLKEVAAKVSRVAVLQNPSNQAHPFVLRQAEGAARTLGLQLHIVQAGTAAEIDAAFATMRSQRAGGVLVLRDSFFLAQRARIAAHAVKDRRLADAWKLKQVRTRSLGTDVVVEGDL